MQDSSAFQYLAIDTIHESTTNPRRTFEESKLHELAESIRQHGLIQPITVRPNAAGFEIVAGARRYRAAQLAELFSVPARIVDIGDAQAQEWQIIENSLRVDVHPYEEATGYRRLLDLPGYEVATIAERTGKSANHIYARLSLLQLIPKIAEAFTQERITASHANLIARLPQESQTPAFAQCWRKDWQDKEPHLLPAKFLAAWIQANLYLSLADAPFDREDPTLNPAAGACTACPRRSGHNTALFSDVLSDECLDGRCFQTKVANHIDREIAATPNLIQIENGYRSPKEKRPGSVQSGHFREIDVAAQNPDAEPAPPCAAAKPAIVVYGKRIGTKLTVCTDKHCPVHDPNAAAEAAVRTVTPAPDAGQSEQHYQQRREEFEDEQGKLAAERKLQREREFQRQQEENEAEQARRDEVHKARMATFERILANAPTILSVAQLRILLRALVSLDPYTFADDVAEHFAGDGNYHDRTAEEILLEIVDGLADDKLTGFALRLILTAHIPVPREGETDFLAEAATAFAPPQPVPRPAKTAKPNKTNKPTPIKTASKPAPNKKPAKKKAAA